MHALVTGATRGIGRELLKQMSAGGVEVTGTYRGPAAPNTPDGVSWIEMDVADAGSVSRAMAGVETPIDLLICNAGIYPDKGQSLEAGYPTQMWTDTFQTNVAGVFLTIQKALPKLDASAKIAIISSQMASSVRAPGGSYIYRASKAAVLNLGRNLATDLKAEGIAVGIYHPGYVQTDMGGAGADITTEASVLGLVERFAALSIETTGCFETWDGREHPY